jgi:AcrR family transcriptional regulator
MTQTRRESLISAAAQLLDKGGVGAVTLREVGRVAGVSHNAPYKHFADKYDLLAAVASRELRHQIAKSASSTSGTSSPPPPKTLITDYVRWAQRYPERFKLTFGRWPRGNDELNEAALHVRAIWLASISRAQARGDLPADEPERLTALVLALAHGAADLAIAGHLSAKGRGRADPEDLVEDLFRHLSTSAAANRRT